LVKVGLPERRKGWRADVRFDSELPFPVVLRREPGLLGPRLASKDDGRGRAPAILRDSALPTGGAQPHVVLGASHLKGDGQKCCRCGPKQNRPPGTGGRL